jgi:3-hydroxymyristoyl/3-hydroxydecanoyl-(acyl carrier protein) dehydratase
MNEAQFGQFTDNPGTPGVLVIEGIAQTACVLALRLVGRLSGVAYCRELEFRTKAAGDERVATIAWDCRGLRERLADSAYPPRERKKD